MAQYDRKDAAYRAAKKSGLRSRAGIKLEDLDARFRFLRPGARVLDLGCWPGAWLQVALARTGASGKVVGIDLVETLDLAGVTFVRGDARDPAVLRQAVEALGGEADVVLSDMAPKLTGIRATDDARLEELAEIAIACAAEVLAPKGTLVLKLFSTVEQFATVRLKQRFRRLSKVRPESTRKGSSELYAVAVEPKG
jgi:23S rRNA (uridine2552-2'-O)-methyltransferase